MALDKAVPEWVGVLASEENLESEGHQGILMSRCGEKRIKYSDNIVDTQLLQREALWLTRVEQMGIDTHRCIEFCRDGLFAILATSYIRGASLTDVIKHSKDALLPERHLNDVISNILDRVDELHAVGIIHGDLKPNNVLMSASGHLHLIDFSNSRRIGEPWEERGVSQRSRRYAYPRKVQYAEFVHDYFALLMTVSALLGKQMSHFDDNITLWLEKLFVVLQSNEVSEEILCRLKAMSTSVVEDLSN